MDQVFEISPCLGLHPVLVAHVPLSSTNRCRGLTDLAGNDKGGSEYHCLICLPCFNITCPIQKQAQVVLCQLFTAKSSRNCSCFLYIFCKPELQLSTSLFDTTPACPGSISKLLPCGLSLNPCLVGSSFCLGICLLVWPLRFIEYWDGPSVLRGGCPPLKSDQLSWAPLPFRAHSHEISFASSLNKPKSALLKPRACALPLSCHPPLPQELGLYYIRISHWLPHPSSALPCQWTSDPAVHHLLWISPSWPMQYLYNKKLPLTSFRISPGWLASSHVALPEDVLDIPLLSESFYGTKTSPNFSKISSFSSLWWVLTHPHHSVTVSGLSSDPHLQILTCPIEESHTAEPLLQMEDRPCSCLLCLSLLKGLYPSVTALSQASCPTTAQQ